jgi:hypothetical protein
MQSSHNYYTSEDAWQVVIVSTKTPEDFYKEGWSYGTYDDELNGATPLVPGHF